MLLARFSDLVLQIKSRCELLACVIPDNVPPSNIILGFPTKSKSVDELFQCI